MTTYTECPDTGFKIPKKEFKVGDRVAVYDAGLRLFGARGRILSSQPVHCWAVELDKETELAAIPAIHEKQLRRLVKKERMKVWLNFYSNTGVMNSSVYTNENDARLGASVNAGSPSYYRGPVEFIEVRRK